MWVCVCACTLVCARARERPREGCKPRLWVNYSPCELETSASKGFCHCGSQTSPRKERGRKRENEADRQTERT